MIKEVMLPIITVCFLAPIVLGIVVTFGCLVINVFLDHYRIYNY
jgi:hypothetical protein